VTFLNIQLFILSRAFVTNIGSNRSNNHHKIIAQNIVDQSELIKFSQVVPYVMGITISAQNKVDDQIDLINDSMEEPWKIVFAKLQKSPVFQAKLSQNMDKMQMFAKQISDVKELKRTYLNTSWTETVKFYNEQSTLDDREPETVPVKKRSSIAKIKDSLSVKSKDEGGDWQRNSLDETTLEQIREQDQFVQDIKVKLVISEIVNTGTKRAIRQLVSPVLDRFHVLPEMGLFHSGVIIGPWKIDWNDSSIVVPKKIIAGAAVMTADLDSIHTLKQLEETVDKVAEVIVKWNIGKLYRDSGGDKKLYGNCQNFNDDLLHALGIKLEFTGPLKNYMDNLRTKGKCDMEFTLEPNFREFFGMNFKSITFKTHLQLDQFVEKLLAVDASFQTNYKSEWVLLKNFDRVYWLKHQKYNDHNEFCPHHSEDGKTVLCPFGDPDTTMSLVGLHK
jgi:hypothetical protein